VRKFFDNKLVFVCIGIACAIIWIIKVFALGIGTFPSGDNLTYASIARSIVENFSISHISALPSDIKTLGGFPQYDISQNIGLPLFLVPFFILFGTNNFAIMMSSLALYIANAFFTFIISYKLFNRKVAITATYLFIFSSSYYNYISSGLTEPLLILLLMMVSYVQFFIRSEYKGVLVGLLIYALYLTKSGLAIFILPYFFVHWLLYEDRSSKYILGIIFTLAIISVPLILRTALLDLSTYSKKSGLLDLVFNISKDKEIWYSGLRSLDFPTDWLDPDRYLVENYQIYVKKYFMTFYTLYLKTYGANYLFSGSVIFCAYVLTQTKNKSENVFKFFTLGLFGLLFFGFSIGWPIERYLLPVAPFILIAIASYAVPVITGANKSYVAIILLIGMQAPWVGFLVKDIYLSGSRVNYDQLGEYIKNNTKDDDIIISNAPGLVGWYSNRKSILYPNSFLQTEKLNDINSKINTVILTDELNSLFRSNLNQNLWDDIYINRSQKIGTRFCLEDVYTDKNQPYSALLYKLCEE